MCLLSLTLSHTHIQEDTDTMIQELERWRAENNSHRENLRREERYYIVPETSILHREISSIHYYNIMCGALCISISPQYN